MTNNISYYISKFFTDELKNIKETSINTRKTYRDAIVQLLNFMLEKYNKKIENLEISDFSADIINQFITTLRLEKELKENTCNVKLAAIQGLFKFIRCKNLQYINICNEIIDLKYKKVEDTFIEFLTIDEITKLFSVFDLSVPIEYNHLMLITTLYETAARIQELCDIKLKDVNFVYNSITLTGKGNKTRIVPVNKVLIKNLSEYAKEKQLSQEDYLFFNKNGKKLTRVGTQYIINKYIDRAKLQFHDLFKIHVTNHTFRHSKAVHLLEAGINIVYIRDILGHSSITTTEIYAKCSLELKKKELEKTCNAIPKNVSYSKSEQDDLLKWLKTMI